MLTRLLWLVVPVAVAVGSPTPALGQGPPMTETVISTHFTKSVVLTDTPPCVGMVTYDIREVFHITAFGGEVAHVTDTQTGDVTFVSTSDGKRYTGRFNGVFNLQANRSNAAYTDVGTYHLRVQSPDGARLRFWITTHVTFAQHAEEPTVEFFNVRCTTSQCVPARRSMASSARSRRRRAFRRSPARGWRASATPRRGEAGS